MRYLGAAPEGAYLRKAKLEGCSYHKGRFLRPCKPGMEKHCRVVKEVPWDVQGDLISV